MSSQDLSDFERINAPRVEKLHKILDMIGKSAKSARATNEEVAALMQTVAARLSIPLTNAAVDVEATKPVRLHPNELMHLAKSAPLIDAVAAMQVIAARVDAELFEGR